MRVLMLTGDWPTPEHPEYAPFVVRQVNYLQRLGATVDVVHVEGRGRPHRYLQVWQRVRRMAAADAYDVIHAQWGQSALVALPKPAPLVVTFRGSDLEGIVGADGRYLMKGRVLRALSQQVARAADGVIVVSDSLGRHIPDVERHLIPSGLDLEHFAPTPRAEARQRLGLDPNRKFVLFASSPARPVKRHALAVDAVSRLDPALRAELLVVSGKPPAEIPLHMSAADALILSSSHEGSPDVIKEALACNLPIVSVDVGDVRQRLSAVEGCVVCADDSAATLARGLDQVLRRVTPIDGRRAVAALDELVLTRQVLAVYERAIARFHGRPLPSVPGAPQ